MLKGGSTYRFVADQLGSVRAVVDVSDGSIVQEIEYDAWGNATFVGGTWDVQPFGFAGGLYDSDTALVRFGARDYDAEVGRWTDKDPAEFRGDGPNLYAYVLNDPVDLIDPLGRFIQCPPGGCGGFFGGFGGAVSGSSGAGAGVGGLAIEVGAALLCLVLEELGDDPYENCKEAAKGGPDEWNDFCDTLVLPSDRAACRAKQFASQTEKENMCHFFFYL